MLKLINMLILKSRGLGLKQKVMPHRPLLRELEQQRCTSSQTLPEEHRMQRPQTVPSSSLTLFIQCLISCLELVLGSQGDGGMCVVLS